MIRVMVRCCLLPIADSDGRCHLLLGVLEMVLVRLDGDWGRATRCGCLGWCIAILVWKITVLTGSRFVLTRHSIYHGTQWVRLTGSCSRNTNRRDDLLRLQLCFGSHFSFVVDNDFRLVVWMATTTTWGARLRLKDADSSGCLILHSRDSYLPDDNFFVYCRSVVWLSHLLYRFLLICKFLLVIVSTSSINGNHLFWRSWEDHLRHLNNCLLLWLLLLLLLMGLL